MYMASGFGRRYGRNKLLEYHNGSRLYEYGLRMLGNVKEELLRMGMSVEICVVSNQAEILDTGRRYGCVFQNPDAEEGMGASVRIGTKVAERFGADASVFFVADQPWLTKESVVRFLQEFLCQKKGIGRVTSNGNHGNPVVFRKAYFPSLSQVSGDQGGRQVIKKHLEDVMYFEVDGFELRDIDYPMDWNSQ